MACPTLLSQGLQAAGSGIPALGCLQLPHRSSSRGAAEPQRLLAAAAQVSLSPAGERRSQHSQAEDPRESHSITATPPSHATALQPHAKPQLIWSLGNSCH